MFYPPSFCNGGGVYKSKVKSQKWWFIFFILMTSATPESLSKFVQFCNQHITGQERKEAQTFLDRFYS
jgi:hypothetical protein